MLKIKIRFIGKYSMIHSIFSTEVIQKCTEISIQAQYSDYCKTQLGHSTNGIPISSNVHHHNTGMPSLQKGIGTMKPSQVHCSLQNSCRLFSFCTLYWPELHIHTPMLVWLSQGNIQTLLMSSGRNIYSTS